MMSLPICRLATQFAGSSLRASEFAAVGTNGKCLLVLLQAGWYVLGDHALPIHYNNILSVDAQHLIAIYKEAHVFQIRSPDLSDTQKGRWYKW